MPFPSFPLKASCQFSPAFRPPRTRPRARFVRSCQHPVGLGPSFKWTHGLQAPARALLVTHEAFRVFLHFIFAGSQRQLRWYFSRSSSTNRVSHCGGSKTTMEQASLCLELSKLYLLVRITNKDNQSYNHNINVINKQET